MSIRRRPGRNGTTTSDPARTSLRLRLGRRRLADIRTVHLQVAMRVPDEPSGVVDDWRLSRNHVDLNAASVVDPRRAGSGWLLAATAIPPAANVVRRERG
jgi:hypothetical protein